MFDYRLGLATGIDLPIPELQATVHPPSILEISYIGEKTFLDGVQLLCINKSMIGENAILLGEEVTNFQIFIQIMNEKRVDAEKKSAVKQVLQLMFPGYAVNFTPRSIVLNLNDVIITIDEGNFEIFQNLIQQIFCLHKSDQATFNPGNAKAQEIANKLMKARQKIAAQKEKEQGNGSALGQYLSILTIGTNTISLKDAMNLTMYQLYDLIERYTLYINWDLDIRARMAGAKNDKPVDNWMKNIH